MKTQLVGLAGLAGVVLSLGACHTNGAYLTGNGTKPKGPGVVDCGWYHRDDEGNTYVEHYCAPSRAAEIAFMAAQQFPVVTPIETKWDGIENYCGEGCVTTTPRVVVATGPGAPGYRPPGTPASGTGARAAAAAAPAPVPPRTTASRLPPSGPYSAGPAAPSGPTRDRRTTGRDYADDQDTNLPPPKPGAPLPVPPRR